MKKVDDSFHCLVAKTFSFGSNYLFLSPFFPCNREGIPFTHLSVSSLVFFMSILKIPFLMFAECPQDFRELKLWLTEMVNIVPPPHFLVSFSLQLSVISQFMLRLATLKDKDCGSVSRAHKTAIIVIEN